MAEAITFFIESAHLMKELVPLLMYLSVYTLQLLLFIIIIGDLASEKPHAQEHTRPVGLGRRKLR